MKTKTKTGILGAAAIAALIGATALTTGASRASIPSSPAERAATAELNRKIMADNAAAENRYRTQEAQYQEQRRQYEALQRQYEAELRNSQDSRN